MSKITPDNLPKTVKLWHLTYTVQIVPYDEISALGILDTETNIIRIADHLSGAILVDTFIHECLHAYFDMVGLVDDEEITCKATSAVCDMLFKGLFDIFESESDGTDNSVQ